jgi:predicted outer membrane repeat protein
LKSFQQFAVVTFVEYTIFLKFITCSAESGGGAISSEDQSSLTLTNPMVFKSNYAGIATQKLLLSSIFRETTFLNIDRSDSNLKQHRLMSVESIRGKGRVHHIELEQQQQQQPSAQSSLSATFTPGAGVGGAIFSISSTLLSVTSSSSSDPIVFISNLADQGGGIFTSATVQTVMYAKQMGLLDFFLFFHFLCCSLQPPQQHGDIFQQLWTLRRRSSVLLGFPFFECTAIAIHQSA